MLSKVSCLVRMDSAVGFYRLWQPAFFMLKEKLIKMVASSAFSGSNTWGEYKGKLILKEDIFAMICKNTDVIWSNFTASKDEIVRMLDARKWSGGKLIIDIDDNVYAVSKDNPGEVAKKLAPEIEKSFQVADGLTVSVPYLKKLYEPFNKNIYINPNGLDFGLFSRLKVRPHKKIRIGWRGAYGHKDDLELVYPAMKQLIKDYGVEFVVLGVSPKEGLVAPDFPVEWNSWVNFCDKDPKTHRTKYTFYKKLADLGLDIAVVPLIDSSYNRAKSNLNVLEWSGLHIPVVASPTENQKDMPINYALNSYEWYDRLENLIKDRSKRLYWGEKAHRFVKENYNMKDIATKLASWLDKLPRRKDMEPDSK